MRRAKRSFQGLTRRAEDLEENFITCRGCNMSHFIERRDLLVSDTHSCLLNTYLRSTSLINMYEAVW